MVTEMRSGKANIHSAVPLITPRIGGGPAGGAMRKWALTMARNSVGTVEAGHQLCGGVGRHRQDHRVLAASAMVSPPKSSASTRSAPKRMARSWCSRRTSAPRAASKASAGSMSVAPSRRARSAAGRRGRRRPASRASRRRRARPSRCGGSVLSAASSNGSTSRSIQAAPCRTMTSPTVLPARRPQQPGQREIIERACARRAARGSKIHQGRRPSLSRSVQRSPLARSTKAKFAPARGPISRSAAPMLAQIIERGAIAGQHQMIAVVDRHAERGVVIGAAAPAGLRRPRARRRCRARPASDRGGKPGQAGADNVDGAAHRKQALQNRLRSTINSSLRCGSRTGGAAAQSRARSAGRE